MAADTWTDQQVRVAKVVVRRGLGGRHDEGVPDPSEAVRVDKNMNFSNFKLGSNNKWEMGFVV